MLHAAVAKSGPASTRHNLFCPLISSRMELSRRWWLINHSPDCGWALMALVRQASGGPELIFPFVSSDRRSLYSMPMSYVDSGPATFALVGFAA